MPRLAPIALATLAAGSLWAGVVASPEARGSEPRERVDFDRQVRPLLSDRCFACHGPDAGSREADLRLDTREGALADLGGGAAVVPGDPDASLLWQRVTADSDRRRMPPVDAHVAPLDEDELALVRRWIEEGAEWARHWAFEPPVRPSSPSPDLHPVDAFVAAGLRARGRELAPEAAPHQLARRLHFDLTGLPPALEDFADWGTGPTDAQWAAAADALLASPAHAERLAMWWLDAARYADTDGFQQDEVRSNWPWRDWVIEAFASNMPFDRFTALQFAGDLIDPDDPEHVLATCFHRNHMHNGEGGRDPEESRIDYVRDRVDTMGAVWLGLTLECAQCHDHKFDPVSQRDYYALSAFFDGIDEDGRAGGGAHPFLEFTSPHAEASLSVAEHERALAREHVRTLRERSRPAFVEWLRETSTSLGGAHEAWRTLDVVQGRSEAAGGRIEPEGVDTFVRAGEPTPQDAFALVVATDGLDQLTGVDLDVLADDDATLGTGPTGDFILTGVRAELLRRGQRIDVVLDAAVATLEGPGVVDRYGAVRGVLDDDPRSGWRVGRDELAASEGSKEFVRARMALREPLPLEPGDTLRLHLLFRSQTDAAFPRRMRLRGTGELGAAARELGPSALEELSRSVAAGVAVPDLPSALRERLHDQFLLEDAVWLDANRRLDRLEAQVESARRAGEPRRVTVLRERATPRTTHVLLRGEWDQKGEAVVPAFPAEVFPWPDADQAERWTRLDLAQWLTHPSHPLTARVVANQVWQLLFGQGLVRTPADFGLQGRRPEHQELLDWLAVELVANGWDLRHLIRTIVTSRTYRQASEVDAELLAADPENLWLARGPRHRLPSWMLRDAALAVSGLLDDRIGGPPVFPHQPPGVWEELFMGRFRYQPTVGGARHRRTLYAFWRRNAAPTFLFDNADRRSCAVDVRRTNTPLQALTLLNDQGFVDAARALARTASDEAAWSVDAQLRLLATRVLQRALDEAELDELRRLHERALATFRAVPEDARTVAAASPLEAVPGAVPEDAVELAALASVATVLLNLDEAITRE